MICFLLLSLLVVDVTETQNTQGTFEGNQTFNLLNTTVEPTNATFTLKKDGWEEMEEELKNNKTSDITEEDESFQDPEYPRLFLECNQEALVEGSHLHCGVPFQVEMSSLGPENWCLLPNVISPYYRMAQCLEILSSYYSCFYPNPDVQEYFLHIHSLYFHNCSKEEVHLEDAPEGLVVALTLIPISLIPVLLYLMIWKLSVTSSTTNLHS
ncbi:receptor activity-modifying protein 3 isoform X1 [Takifugu rubripes]|uniref:Receptor activity-modifying protein 3-like n=1 Tax=Takifugu rubripes TaxID=31033 RepID=A0A674NS09_TAKRU|nr:receptor activity-modifying protein 3-like isoform X1 [Takifugu rubripes]